MWHALQLWRAVGLRRTVQLRRAVQPRDQPALAMTVAGPAAPVRTVLELGFGLAEEFLATVERQVGQGLRAISGPRAPLSPVEPLSPPAPLSPVAFPIRVFHVAIEAQPRTAADLTAALSRRGVDAAIAVPLLSSWPGHRKGLYRLRFDAFQTSLLLCIGHTEDWLRQLSLVADEVHLGSGWPSIAEVARRLALLKSIGRLCAPNARLIGYDGPAEGDRLLTQCGFSSSSQGIVFRPAWQDRLGEPGMGGKPGSPDAQGALPAIHSVLPLARSTVPLSRHTLPFVTADSASPHAVVVGAGLAGSAMTRELL